MSCGKYIEVEWCDVVRTLRMNRKFVEAEWVSCSENIETGW